MNLNTAKIEELIREGVNSVVDMSNPWIREDACIGELKGVQVQIIATSDESDFLDSPTKNNIAVASK